MALELAVTSPDPEGRTVRRYRFARSQSAILLGRRGGCDVLLPLDDVEPVHARIESHQHTFCLVDLNSQLGTQLNGARIPSGQALPLSEGDRIEIAGAVVDVRLDPDRVEELPDLGARVMRELFAILPAEAAHPTLVAGDRVLALEQVGHTYVLGHQPDGLGLEEVDLWREQVAVTRSEIDVKVRPLSDRLVLRNGARLTAPTVLSDGDELRLGDRAAIFHDPSARYKARLVEAPAAPRPAAGDADRLPLHLALVGASVGLIALVAMIWLLLAS